MQPLISSVFSMRILTQVLLLTYCTRGERHGLVSNFLEDETGRYANGESSQIVAQYMEPVSREIPSSPLFYGFFYSYNISDSLRLITEKFFAAGYDTVPEFKKFLDQLMTRANITDPFAYYQKPVDPESGRFDPYFHTTAKFCGRKNCLEYWNKAGKYLGKPFDMHLVGLFFTPRTFGIRVKLTDQEQSIFEEDERQNTMQVAKSDEPGNSRTEAPVVGYEYEGYFRSRLDKVKNHPLYPGVRFVPQEKDFHPTESRAHITIGCAPGVLAVQTGLDLLEAIDLEISGHVLHEDYQIGGGDIPESIFRSYKAEYEQNDLFDLEAELSEESEKETVFVIYPDEKMVTTATFSVYL